MLILVLKWCAFLAVCISLSSVPRGLAVEQHGWHDLQLSTRALQQSAELLCVFHYDGMFDWERVNASEPEAAAAIAWLRGIPDRLTMTTQAPAGLSLQVCPHVADILWVKMVCLLMELDHLVHLLMQIPYQMWVPEPAQRLCVVGDQFQDVSLAAVIEAQLLTNSETILLPNMLLVIYQLSL